jgi:hypothetical protein
MSMVKAMVLEPTKYSVCLDLFLYNVQHRTSHLVKAQMMGVNLQIKFGREAKSNQMIVQWNSGRSRISEIFSAVLGFRC